MAATGLSRAAMAAPVVGDDAIAVLEEEQQLCVPVIGAKRPAMAEYDGLAIAPVLVVNFRTIFCFDRAHFVFSSDYGFGLEFADNLGQEPCAALGLVNPNLNEACGGNVTMPPADLVCLAQEVR